MFIETIVIFINMYLITCYGIVCFVVPNLLGENMILSFLLACGPKMPTAQSMSIVPSASVYLRNSFDMDPSSYVGRFVTDGDQSLDEASGMAMSCSKYITHRFVEGGGVRYNEILNVSTSVGARLGVPMLGSAKGNYGSSGVVRVQYELMGKMLSEIHEPEKFRQCCIDYPDQCTRRYIGEFLQGKGVVYTEYTQGGNAAGNAIDPGSGVEGEVSFSHGKNWKRGIEFPNPVYFAFKINQTPYGELKQCADWMSRVPQSDKGQYFVGISTFFEDESKARKDAQKKATEEAMRAGFISYETGPTKMVPEDWCMETSYQNGITKYKAKALVLIYHPTPSPALREEVTPAEATSSLPEATRQPANVQSDADQEVKFLSLLNRLGSMNFDSDKVKEIEASAGFPITCAQVSAILNELKFSDDQVQVVQILRPSITDPQNSMVLEQNFTFDSDKEKVRALFR